MKFFRWPPFPFCWVQQSSCKLRKSYLLFHWSERQMNCWLCGMRHLYLIHAWTKNSNYYFVMRFECDREQESAASSLLLARFKLIFTWGGRDCMKKPSDCILLSPTNVFLTLHFSWTLWAYSTMKLLADSWHCGFLEKRAGRVQAWLEVAALWIAGCHRKSG